MPLFDNIADLVYEKLHEQGEFDNKDKELIRGIIDNSVAFVAKRILNRSQNDEELKEEITQVAANAAIFLSVVIVQLEFFGKGLNDGPFFDMLAGVLNGEAENSYNRRYSSDE